MPGEDRDKRRGRSGDSLPDRIELPYTVASFAQLLRAAARGDTSYTHQQIADWSERFWHEVSEGARQATATDGERHAAEIALDVDAQWELFLVNTFSSEELQSTDLSTVRLPLDWFRDWLRRLEGDSAATQKHNAVALNLLGSLASLALQRRYIVRATKDEYLVPEELLNDADYFLHHPDLQQIQSLPSVQEFARVLRECAPKVPFDDPTVSNRALIEKDPHWARIRSAANAVLQEMGADGTASEREELQTDAKTRDELEVAPEISDARRIVAALEATRKRPTPKNPSAIGGVTSVAAIAGLILLPFVGRWTALSSTALWSIGIALGLAALGGGLLANIGSMFVRGAVARDVEKAIEQLVANYPHGSPAKLRRAAVRILDQSTVSTGPATVGTFDRAKVAEQLGDALAYVLYVERVLLERNEIYPCFTLLEPAFGHATRT